MAKEWTLVFCGLFGRHLAELDEDGFELEMGCSNGLLEPVHSQAGEIFSNYM